MFTINLHTNIIINSKPNIQPNNQKSKTINTITTNNHHIINHQTIKMTLRLASGSYDGTIRFWDPGTGTSIQGETINLSNSIPNKIEISESKSKLVVGMNNYVKIYDLNRPTQPQKVIGPTEFKGNVTSVGFRMHDKTIYTSCEDGYLKLFDLRGKSKAREMKQNKPINCAVFHPNQKEILSGDEGGHFRIWDIGTEKEKINILSENQVGIRSISISQNGENVVFADSKGWIQPYSGQQLIHHKAIQAHQDYILKCQISPNNKFLATCSADKKINLYKIISDGANKFELFEYKPLKGHFRWVWDCQFSCDSAYLISCSTDATIKLWNVDKAELVQTLKGHEKGVVCLALNDIAEVNA